MCRCRVKRQDTRVQHKSAATEPVPDDRDKPWMTVHAAGSTAIDLVAGSSHREAAGPGVVRMPHSCHIEAGLGHTGSHSRTTRIAVDLGIRR